MSAILLNSLTVSSKRRIVSASAIGLAVLSIHCGTPPATLEVDRQSFVPCQGPDRDRDVNLATTSDSAESAAPNRQEGPRT